MRDEKVTIPEARSGWLGYWDKFAGPGWSRQENLVLWPFTLFAGFAVPVYAAIAGLGWGFWQYVIALALAVDIAGGALTMAGNPGKRWCFRPGMGFMQHMGFILMHVHPFLVAWLYNDNMDWTFAVFSYVYLICCSLVMLFSPLYLKRIWATAFIVTACVLNGAYLTPPPGFFWFLPVFYVKLLSGHLVEERIYTPEDG